MENCTIMVCNIIVSYLWNFTTYMYLCQYPRLQIAIIYYYYTIYTVFEFLLVYASHVVYDENNGGTGCSKALQLVFTCWNWPFCIFYIKKCTPRSHTSIYFLIVIYKSCSIDCPENHTPNVSIISICHSKRSSAPIFSLQRV